MEKPGITFALIKYLKNTYGWVTFWIKMLVTDVHLYVKCHFFIGVFYIFCSCISTTWFLHKWKIDCKWADNKLPCLCQVFRFVSTDSYGFTYFKIRRKRYVWSRKRCTEVVPKRFSNKKTCAEKCSKFIREHPCWNVILI